MRRLEQGRSLYEILGLCCVPDYGVRQPIHILPISVKEHEKGFVVSLRDFATQHFIGASAKLLETVRSFSKNHLSLSRVASTNTRSHQNEIHLDDGHLSGMNNPQQSERQHTTELHEMKVLYACRRGKYFFVVVVQLGHPLRSAPSPRPDSSERNEYVPSFALRELDVVVQS